MPWYAKYFFYFLLFSCNTEDTLFNPPTHYCSLFVVNFNIYCLCCNDTEKKEQVVAAGTTVLLLEFVMSSVDGYDEYDEFSVDKDATGGDRS